MICLSRFIEIITKHNSLNWLYICFDIGGLWVWTLA